MPDSSFCSDPNKIIQLPGTRPAPVNTKPIDQQVFDLLDGHDPLKIRSYAKEIIGKLATIADLDPTLMAVVNGYLAGIIHAIQADISKTYIRSKSE